MRFSIRDLLWLTIVVALLLCLCLQHWAYTKDVDSLRQLLIEEHLKVNYWKGIHP